MASSPATRIQEDCKVPVRRSRTGSPSLFREGLGEGFERSRQFAFKMPSQATTMSLKFPKSWNSNFEATLYFLSWASPKRGEGDPVQLRRAGTLQFSWPPERFRRPCCCRIACSSPLSATEVAAALGYKSHSRVSRALQRIEPPPPQLARTILRIE